ncbi:MAG: hypothetical protein ACM31H_01085 [Nitrososphaerales archaeon]
MTPLRGTILVKRETPEYTGLLVGVSTGDTVYSRVLGVGEDVTLVSLNDKVLVDWNNVKLVNGDLFCVKEKDVLAVLDD